MRHIVISLFIATLFHTDLAEPVAAPVIITTALATTPAAPVVATTAACAAFGWWCYHAIKAHRLASCHKYLRTMLTDEQYRAFCREQNKYLSPYGVTAVNDLSTDDQASLVTVLTQKHAHTPAFYFTTTPPAQPHIRVKRTELLNKIQQQLTPSLSPESITTQPCMGIYEQHDITYQNPPRSCDRATTDGTTSQSPGKNYEECPCLCHDLRVGIPAPLCTTCPLQHPHPYGAVSCKSRSSSQ